MRVNKGSYRFQEIVQKINKYQKGNLHSDGLQEILFKLSLLTDKRSLSSYHALIQYVLALNLHKKGYDVWVEKPLPEGLKADVYAEHPLGSVIIEVETGYIPKSCIERPLSFLIGKIVHKALLYSKYSDKFFIALPAYISLPNELIYNKVKAFKIYLSVKDCFSSAPLLRRFKLDSLIKVYTDSLKVVPDPETWWQL